MGYISQSNEVITATSKRFDDILDSPMTQYLQQGQPVLVTYFNSNHLNTSTDNGLGTTDELLGPNSSLRYNRIEELPVYGMLRDFIVELQDNEGVFDINMELSDLTVPPNTIVPTPYDYIIYTFGVHNERVVLFRVTEIKKNSVRSHTFQKFSVKLYDIDSFGEIEKLNKQVVKTFHAKLDNIGTNEKCILENEQYQYSNRIQKLVASLVEGYVDTFYSSKYHSLIFCGELEQGYISYDPWLTHFCISNRILESDKSMVVLANLDQDDKSRQKYNKTFYHALETRSMKKFVELLFTPTTFAKITANPFQYYGENVAFKIDVYEEEEIKYPRNIYTDFNFIKNIKNGTGESISFSVVENLLIRFFKEESLVNKITEEELYELENFPIECDGFCFRVIPMMIYVLTTYNDDIMNSYA